MISEARLLIRTRKAGLSVPSVWDLDYEGGQLIIEHLDGRPLIDVLNDESTTEKEANAVLHRVGEACLLYTSPSPRDFEASRMPSSA